ncbi:hypothetical protein [Bradyrhizobium centrolobii]|nr:hypothetical protein [Bradyrhizobium centrolobii]
MPPSMNPALKWDSRGRVPAKLSSLGKDGNRASASVQATHKPQMTSDDVRIDEDLSKFKPYSKEWVAALEAINRAADERLNKRLIICLGCLPPGRGDRAESTGSSDLPKGSSRVVAEPALSSSGVVP